MTEEEQNSVEVLNELHAAGRRSLLPRLAEMNNFVSWASADDLELVTRMIAEEREQQSWLVEEIERCGGGLYPTSADLTTANLHYLELHTVMPRVIASIEALVVTDAAASGRGPLTPATADLINRIARRRQDHLDQLKRLQAHAFSGPC